MPCFSVALSGVKNGNEDPGTITVLRLLYHDFSPGAKETRLLRGKNRLLYCFNVL